MAVVQIPRSGALAPCPSPSTTSSLPFDPSRIPSCTAPSSTSTWCEMCASTVLSVALEVTLTVAGCPLRNEIQSRVTNALDGIGVSRRRPVLRRDDRRAASHAAREAARRPIGHRRQSSRSRPRRGPRHPVRRPREHHPGAADRVGQGRRRQVLGHHEPRRRPRPAGPGRGRDRRRRVGLLDPEDARRGAPSGGHRLDARPARPPQEGCAASRWGSSPRRTSRSSGGARCSTRPSSSSSPTSSGTSPTSSSSTCRPAPATSRCRSRSSSRGRRSTS